MNEFVWLARVPALPRWSAWPTLAGVARGVAAW